MRYPSRVIKIIVKEHVCFNVVVRVIIDARFEFVQALAYFSVIRQARAIAVYVQLDIGEIPVVKLDIGARFFRALSDNFFRLVETVAVLRDTVFRIALKNIQLHALLPLFWFVRL